MVHIHPTTLFANAGLNLPRRIVPHVLRVSSLTVWLPVLDLA